MFEQAIKSKLKKISLSLISEEVMPAFEKTEYNQIGYITTPTEWVKIDKAD